MGLSLASAAKRFAQDQFVGWDAMSDTFSAIAQTGRLFRTDRFTTIYHRPTRRSTLSLLGEWPASGVVRRVFGGEVLLVGANERQEIIGGSVVYDRLRQVHFVQQPSGGKGDYYPASVSGSGDDLGVVTLGPAEPLYLDLELHAVNEPAAAVDYVVGKFLLTHSANAALQAGDYVAYASRWFLVEQPYVDGGFRLARVREQVVGYQTFSYLRPGSGAYDPVTGSVTRGESPRLFSGIIESGQTVLSGPTTLPRQLIVGVFKRHLGFVPQAGDGVSLGNQRYTITTCAQVRDEQQWRLTLEA